MIQQIVILFTILSIFEKYKGAQCANDISEHIDVFNIDAFEEFNLMCYVSMYANIKAILNFMDKHPNRQPNSRIHEINQFSFNLLRINTWRKFLKEPSTIWEDFCNIKKWIDNPNNPETKKIVLEDTISTLSSSKFKNYDWTTPRGKTFFKTSHTSKTGKMKKMVYSTFTFCQNTLNNLSLPTAHLEPLLNNQFIQNAENRVPVSSFFGIVVNLMKYDDYLKFIYDKQDDDQAISLVYVIDDALQDMYIGLVNTLVPITKLSYAQTYTIDHELIKIMKTVFCNVVKLTEEIFHTKDIRGVREKLYEMYQTKTDGTFIYSSYDYETFKNDFHQIYREKISDEFQDYTPSVPQFSNGRLIKYGEVEPSIIGYYAVYEESWDDHEAINYTNNTDDRIEFLLELNAWTIVLHQMLQELRQLLAHRGLQDNLSDKPDFAQDIGVIYQSM